MLSVRRDLDTLQKGSAPHKGIPAPYCWTTRSLSAGQISLILMDHVDRYSVLNKGDHVGWFAFFAGLYRAERRFSDLRSGRVSLHHRCQ